MHYSQFVEVIRYSDSNCTSMLNVEYFELDICRYQTYGTCYRDTASIRYYRKGCGTTPLTTFTSYIVGQCVLEGGTYAMARCGGAKYNGTTNPITPFNTSPTTLTTTSESVVSQPQFVALLIATYFAVLWIM